MEQYSKISRRIILSDLLASIGFLTSAVLVWVGYITGNFAFEAMAYIPLSLTVTYLLYLALLPVVGGIRHDS